MGYIYSLLLTFLLCEPSSILSANSKVNKVFWRTLCARAEKQKMLWKHEDYVEEFTVPDDNHSDLHNTTDGLLLMHVGIV